ncbi:hypothetical protein HPB51_028038 [Rhipicephalus microplus]|uniref:Uncharacterized protein n=1 Tax=Rhipicephalus microplus TaxID=6941 RepID=A0A9J6CYA7_RHIMP|nr:hypothetical protein HPB51_028038 [Rhipicephalus microplus]
MEPLVRKLCMNEMAHMLASMKRGLAEPLQGRWPDPQYSAPGVDPSAGEGHVWLGTNRNSGDERRVLSLKETRVKKLIESTDVGLAEEDDDSYDSIDLVSILKVKTPEQPQPVDKTWSALLVGSGVLLAVVAVGTLFFLTAMGFKTSNSHGVKTGALRSGGGGGNRARHGASTSEHSVSATQSTTRVRHVSVVHITRHTGAGQLGNDSSDIVSNASDSSTDSTDKTKAWSKATSSASSSRSGRITTSSTGGVRTHGNVTITKRPSSVPTASTRKQILPVKAID